VIGSEGRRGPGLPGPPQPVVSGEELG